MASNSMSLSCSGNRSLSNDRKTEFRNILEDVINLEENFHDNLQTIQKTSEILKEVDNLYEAVDDALRHPGESYLDSKVLCATSLLAVRCSKSVSGNLNKYDKSELAKHIASNPDFWEFPFPYEVPTMSYLYGTFAPTPPEQRPRAPRKRVEKQKAAALKVPMNKENVSQTVKDGAMFDKARNFVKKFVKRACRNGPLCYFKVVLDPNSFTKSIENIYYLSFLVADNCLEVFIDESTGLPFINSVSRGGGRGRSTNQFILSMDMKLYRALIKAFDIREAMMVIEKD